MLPAMLQMLAGLLRVLNAETAPGQISLAVCFGMVAGFTPFWSLHNLLVFFLVLVLRVNLSAFLLALSVFSGLAFALDPLFHRIGLALLTALSLEGLWTALYQSTPWRLERFNNTIVMGSLALSLALGLPLYVLLNRLIVRYREHVMQWVLKSRIMQAFTASRFYRIYQNVSGLGGGL